MKLSDMINAHVNAVATNTTGKAVLTQDIETGEASMKKGETLTIMYQQGNLYHGEHNDFSAMLERGDFEWVGATVECAACDGRGHTITVHNYDGPSEVKEICIECDGDGEIVNKGVDESADAA